MGLVSIALLSCFLGTEAGDSNSCLSGTSSNPAGCSVAAQASSPHVTETPSLPEVEALYLAAVKLNPANVTAYHRLGWLRDRSAAHTEAEEFYRKGLQVDLANIYIHDSLAALLLRRGAFEEAEASHRMVLRAVPDRSATLKTLGKLLYNSDRLAEAEVAFLSACMASPEDFVSASYLAALLDERGAMAEATASYTNALRINPQAGDIWLRLANLQIHEHGPSLEAQASLAAAIRLAPTDEEARHVHLYMLKTEHRWMEAQAFIKEGLLLQPQSHQIQLSLANILRRQGATAEQEALLHSILKLNPSMVTVMTRLADVAVKRGGVEEAVHLYHEALRIDPAHYQVRRDLGGVSLLQGHPEAALVEWQQVFEILHASGKSPAWFIRQSGMVPDEAAYQANVRDEAVDFRAYCENALGGGTDPLPARLSRVLADVRGLENSSDWILEVSAEMVTRFGMTRPSEFYSSLNFSAWKAVADRPALRDAALTPGSLAIVMGSALGYQCIFALAVGFSHCIGYDMLCSSMVAHARRLVVEHGLGHKVEFHCQDALAANLSEAAMVWVNSDGADAVYNTEFRASLHTKLMLELHNDAVLVTWQRPPEAFQVVDRVYVQTTWQRHTLVWVSRRMAGD